jgi:deoxyuridine 5'-triphosphate nucleotidohydrolase
MKPTIAVARLPEGEGLPLPVYMSDGAAGADVVAAVAEDLVLAPGARALVPTGFALEVPIGYEVQVRPRSGLALKAGVTCLNSPGTIDSDYRGPVGVILVNHGDEPFVVRRGDRIAQLVVAPVARASFGEAGVLAASVRGNGGFGSTGS